ncbi:IclR family transcriptional regulator [Halalkalibacter krulwichiae]|uniref:Transcriptional regulator KdgR n=1 Tax=Halalkalibacter krulwichiae TaxID=199441 RepID=A0A1X9MJ27_9BACI|nr:IclR family transcriptional regulator [Halalkalibacter krulwichiae]ARK32303.1 Transcriptional regulator KdgR [Halalkalibacter krulwichiae]
MSDQYVLKTLVNAIDVLSIFEEEVELTPSEIEHRVKMNRTNLFRILYTLRQGGVLECDPETGKYRIGMKLVHLSSLYLKRLDIRTISHPHLVELRDSLNETVHLVVMNNERATFVDKVESGGELDINMGSYVGWSAPLYCTASGKLLLSFESDEKVVQYASTETMKRYTHNTLTTKKEFLDSIAEIRELGYAMDKEEMVEGLTCISCPIVDENQKVLAAISVSGATTRMKSKHDFVLTQLFETATKIAEIKKKIPN